METLWNDKKCGGYLQFIKPNFFYRIRKPSLVANPDIHPNAGKKGEKSLRSITKFHEYLQDMKHNF